MFQGDGVKHCLGLPTDPLLKGKKEGKEENREGGKGGRKEENKEGGKGGR